MIPVNSVKVRSNMPAMAYPDNQKITGLVDQELGGIAIADASKGLVGWTWTVEVIGNEVMLTRNGMPSTLLMVQSGIVDIALAFDQNMRPALAWQDDQEHIWLRVYDSVTQVFVTTDFGIGRSPRLTLDDKREVALSTSDIIFAYISNTKLCYRQQREAYLIEHIIATVPSGLQRLDRVGMGGLHLIFELSPNTEDL